jgi:hypothetical protein
VTFTITASLFPVPTPATAATPCQLSSAALSLTDQEGQPLAIDGNGAALSLGNELGQNDAEVAFVWSNWCGETGVHFADLTLGEQHSGFKFSETPTCADASQPSTLRASAVPNPTPTPTVTLELCGPDSYTLEVSAQGYTGTLGFGAGIVLTGAPCHLTADATLAILDADGNALEVDGNPATLHVDANLTAAGLSVNGGWRNWCGEQGDYQFVVTLGQQGAGLPVTAYARCDQPDQPSTLTHVAVYDPNAPPVRPLVPTATP